MRSETHETFTLEANFVSYRDHWPAQLSTGGAGKGRDDVGELSDFVANSWERRPPIRTGLPAVFLDRDGTLNLDVGGVSSPDQLELIPGAAEAIQSLNRAGILAIVVTNQAAVARGTCTESVLDQIHDRLEVLLEKEDAYVDAIYYCPHHPEPDSPVERSEFITECTCRKPAIGMIERARSDFSIRMEDSWLIGDTTVDLQTARNAGLRSILVRTGYGGRDGRWDVGADFEFSDLKEAAQFVIA